MTSLTKSRVVLHFFKLIRLARFPLEEMKLREAYAMLLACKESKAILDEVPTSIMYCAAVMVQLRAVCNTCISVVYICKVQQIQTNIVNTQYDIVMIVIFIMVTLQNHFILLP